MKQAAAIILFFLTFSVLFPGCGSQNANQAKAAQTTAIANPWSDWDSMKEAEDAVGFSFGLPETIADQYTATAFRTLNNELIEVIYRDGDLEVRVRKQQGEGLDISGDYNQYDTCMETSYNGGTITNYHNSDNNAAKQIISYQGYSWSLVAPSGCWGDSNWDFICKIMN